MFAACGNGFRERDEECDDGNLMSHDGCSSRCRIETPVWTELAPAMSPPVRSLHSMAYDAERGRIVLFGGQSQTGLYGDAWTWGGTTWSPLMSQPRPDPRYSATMAYDVARRQLVLFGGERIGYVYFADTWLWDGIAWTQASPAMSPSARASAMAYDSVGRRVILFGGFDSPSHDLTGTWQWNGTWSITTTVTSPPATDMQVLVDDPPRGQVVGSSSQPPMTWVFDGTDWSSQPPNVDVNHRSYAAATHDRATGRIVLFGGFGGFPLNDTWEWNGTSWTSIAVATLPPARMSSALAYDALHHRAILFGGQVSSVFLGDTWSFRYERDGEPDETCIAGEDADGDGLSGCDDPDCWGYCKPSCPPGAPCDPAAPHCGDGVCNHDLEPRVCPSDCP
jgi:cysteine-rich repeat protein